MNLLILTRTFPENKNDWGGIFVKDQADALSQEHIVSVVKCEVNIKKFSPFFSSEITREGSYCYPVIRIRIARSFPVYNQFNYILTTFLCLRKIVKIEKPDLIHCHYSYPCGIVAALISVFFGIPFVTTEHTKIRLTFRSFFHKHLSFFAMKKARYIIAVSRALKEEIASEGIENTLVVPNVTDTKRFSYSITPPEVFAIGFLGSLNTHNKGLDTLLKACSKLSIDFKLRIGGGGVHLDFYKKMAASLGIEGKCEFVGIVLQEEVPVFYKTLSVFVLASNYETFGIVLVEALASGLPVVATNCGGPADIVTRETGILVNIGDSDEMKLALEKIYSSFSGYDRKGISEYANDNFGQQAFIKRMNEIYCKCLLR